MTSEHEEEGQAEGLVVEALPQGLFRVTLEDGRSVVASWGAQARRVMVKVQPGDRVVLVVSPSSPSRGRIKRRS